MRIWKLTLRGIPGARDQGPHTSWDNSVRAGTTSGGPRRLEAVRVHVVGVHHTWNANGASDLPRPADEGHLPVVREVVDQQRVVHAILRRHADRYLRYRILVATIPRQPVVWSPNPPDIGRRRSLIARRRSNMMRRHDRGIRRRAGR